MAHPSLMAMYCMHVHCKDTYINKHSLHGLEVIHAYY